MLEQTSRQTLAIYGNKNTRDREWVTKVRQRKVEKQRETDATRKRGKTSMDVYVGFSRLTTRGSDPPRFFCRVGCRQNATLRTG